MDAKKEVIDGKPVLTITKEVKDFLTKSQIEEQIAFYEKENTNMLESIDKNNIEIAKLNGYLGLLE